VSCAVLAFAASAEGAIVRLEAVTHFDGDLAVTTMPQIGGGTDQTYVLVISTESNSDVTNVRDTLDELSWVERKEQCTVSNGESGIRLWTAQGTPSGPFQVEITHAVAGKDLTAVLARYSGVGSFQDATGENTNGENDVTCAGTTKTTTAQLTLTSTNDQSVHVIGVCPKQSFITSYSPGYALIDGEQSGRAYTFVYDRTFATAATDQFQATVNGASVKWGTAGIVLSPSAPATVNYRSIGVTTGNLASGNDASINATESTVVLGGSETFPANIGQGDKLTITAAAGSYSDDFTDENIIGWTKVGIDSLSESGGTLQASGSATTDAHYTVDAGAAWTDYTVSCDVRADDDDYQGISFRVQDGNNFYLFFHVFGDAGPDSWDVYLQKVVGGTRTDLVASYDNEGAAAGQIDSEGVFYTFKVVVSGINIKCYIDDVLKFDVNDATYSDGTVGVWCESHEGRWDNMLVTGLGGGDTVFHVLTRDSDTQVTVQETAAQTLSNESWSIERAFNHFWTWKGDRNGDLVAENRREVGVCYNDGPFVPSGPRPPMPTTT
jgi:hypothetical protein